MRSRTSLCNRADLRVDFTRFAPLWALYTVLLAAIIMMCLPQSKTAYDTAYVLSGLAGLMAPIQFCYALLTAQCLFGYLYDTRLCYTIHAMPQTRLCRFRTHVLAGLLFALVPDLLAAGLCWVIAPEVKTAVAWWLVAAAGQYVFFFSFAVLSVLCAGNRVGGALVYGIGNFLPLMAAWLAGSIFQPLLFGITVPTEPFDLACPLVQLTREDYLTLVAPVVDVNVGPVLEAIYPGQARMAYLALCCAFALVFLIVAGGLYRDRPLESAGELLAVKALRPVFLLLFTLAAGAFLQLFASIVVGSTAYGYLLAGMVVGYFVGKMLLERQVNVFRLRAIPGIAAICAVFFALLLLTGLDVTGIIRAVPAEDSIASVSVIPYISEDGLGVTSQDPADIQAVLALHRGEVDSWKSWRKDNRGISGLLTESYGHSLFGEDRNSIRLTLRYQLKNGRMVEREYQVETQSKSGSIAADFLKRPENVLGIKDRSALYSIGVRKVEVYGDWGCGSYCTVSDITGLLNAIYDDCAAGRILPGVYLEDTDGYLGTLSLIRQDQERIIWLPIYDSYTSTVSYLEENTVAFPEDGERP